MKWLRQAGQIARIEFGLLRRFPRLCGAALVVVLIPALYALIYLSSVWDPAARTEALPVGVINLDQGFQYREQNFNIGEDVLGKLRNKRQFGYHDMASEAEARQLVRQGKLAFALIIPADFSANAIPGVQAGSGKLVVYTSAGNNYESSLLASQFAKALSEEVNDALNEQRWALVLSSSAGSQQSVDRLREGVGQLRAGAQELVAGHKLASRGSEALATGATRLHEGVNQLGEGSKQVGAGVRTILAKLPPANEVRQLRIGAEALATGHDELSKGLLELHGGSQRLLGGTAQFQEESTNSLFVPAKLQEGLGQLRQGLGQLDQGLGHAVQAQQQLSQGAGQLSTGVRVLTGGVRDLRANLNTLVSKLPEDTQLDQLNQGAVELAQGNARLNAEHKRLNEGAQFLAAGIDLLLHELPTSMHAIEGSAEGLAHSVTPVLEVQAPVANHGSGFAPNVIPAALWLGAGIAAFLIHVRLLPNAARRFSPGAQLLGKVALPAVVVLAQALLLLGLILWVLCIEVQNIPALALVLGVSALTFLFIVVALTRVFGDAGKALAMILLALQLSSSGGVLPVELSGSLYALISPWLPLTWVVQALKASMFGAYEGNWLYPLALIGLGGLAAAGLAGRLGRWRYVRPQMMRPAVDLN